MRTLIATVLIVTMFAGPLTAQEVRHKGRTLAEWTAKLREKTEVDRDAAIDALVSFGARAIPALIPMLRDPEADVRLGVIWTFYRIGRPAKQALPELLRTAVKDPHDELQIYAGSIAAQWLAGPAPLFPAAESVPMLIRAMQDPDADLRHAAARYLAIVVQDNRGRLDPGVAGPLVTALIQTLREPDVELRREAAGALGVMGPAARAAIPELRRMARDDADNRHQAETALRSIENR
jgi:HEAT repeat protein